MLILALQLNGDCHFPPLIFRLQWCSKASWSPLRIAIDLPWEFPSPTLYHKSCTMRVLLVKSCPLLYFTLSCEQQRKLLVFRCLVVIGQIFRFLLKDPFLLVPRLADRVRIHVWEQNTVWNSVPPLPSAAHGFGTGPSLSTWPFMPITFWWPVLPVKFQQ